MEYRTLGRTGVKVSPLCLGTMHFGNLTAEEDAIRIIDAALDAGINFIDTANRYGEGGPYGSGGSEIIIGRALKANGKRDQTVLATKVHYQMDPADPNSGGLSRRAIIQQTEACLRRLDTDYIDLLQLHRDDPSIPVDEPLRALDDLVRAGKVRYIAPGFNVAWRFVEALCVSERLGLARYVSGQAMYSILVRSAERSYLPMAQEYGVGFMAHSPLNGGFFSGKFSKDDREPEDSRMVDWGWHEMLTEQAWEALDEVGQIAAEKDCTVSQFATAWVMDRPGVTTAIIGPRTMSHLEDSLGALDVELTDDDRQRIDEVTIPRGNVWGPHQPRPARA